MGPLLYANCGYLRKKLRSSAEDLPQPEPTEAARQHSSPSLPDALTASVTQHSHWRVAVLPFNGFLGTGGTNLSRDLTKEISAAIAYSRMASVVATGSLWQNTGLSDIALAKAREFSLDYVVGGLIQNVADRIRVTVNVLSVGRGLEMIWAGRFDGKTSDLLDLQLVVVSQTVAQIDAELLGRRR